jgi:hypothetical protein
MKHKGVGGRRKVKDEVKTMLNIADIIKGKKAQIKKRRGKETKPRDMREKLLERKILFRLNVSYKAIKVGETSTYNSYFCLDGITDIMVFGHFGVVFMEVKVPEMKNRKDGGLRKSQIKFRDMCRNFGLNHCVVYSVEEASRIMLSYKNQQNMGEENEETKKIIGQETQNKH